MFGLTLIGYLRLPLLPSIGRDLDVSAFGLSALAGSFGLGRVLVDLPAGRATDRHSVGRMMATAAAVVAAGAFVMSAAPHVAVVLVGAALLGIGSSWAAAGAVAFFASAPKASRGTSVSMYGGALLVAQAVGPMVAGFAALILSWRAVLFGGGLAALAGVGLALQMRYVSPAGREATRTSPTAETPAPRYVLWLTYALPAVQFGIGAAVIQTLIPIVGEDDLGFSTGTVGLALGIGGGIRLVAALTAGVMSDRVGRRAALLPGLAIQLAGLIVFAVGTGAVAWWASILLLTLGSIAANVGGTIIADLSEGGPLGRRLGRYRLIGDLSLMISPIVTGWLFDRYGLRVAMLPLLAMGSAILVGAFKLPETHRV